MSFLLSIEIKNMKKLTFLFACIFFSSVLFSQTYTLRGVLTDKNTGETLIGANVLSASSGTVTEYDGSYELKLEKGSHEITFSYVGYKTVSIPMSMSYKDVLIY